MLLSLVHRNYQRKHLHGCYLHTAVLADSIHNIIMLKCLSPDVHSLGSRALCIYAVRLLANSHSHLSQSAHSRQYRDCTHLPWHH